MKAVSGLIFGALLIAADVAEARDNFPGQMHQGVHRYRYELTERAPGQPDKSYRLDYDLINGHDGSVVAIVRHAAQADGDTWSDASIDASCASALHAHRGELARITLWPIAREAAESLDESFLANCAPAAVVYPILDVLNVVLVQTAPDFGLSGLHHPGDHARTPAYATHFDRLGSGISVSAPGGETRLVSLDADSTIVEWASDPMDLTIVKHGAMNGQDLTLSGQEHFAFRLEIDPRTGALKRAATISDTLELVVELPNVPVDRAPHLAVTRSVTIESR